MARTRDDSKPAQPRHPFVEETPGVGGGYPQVRGTRIPVRTIVAYHRAYGDVDRIQRMFPYLTREQIQGALDYYAKSPGRVDEDFERNARALAQLQGRQYHLAST
jgi:uncharacterized protein (DUF433 family)